MKSLFKSICLVLPILLLVPFKGNSQGIEPKDTTRQFMIRAAKEIMAASNTCALITLDEDGIPRVRAMDPFAPENDPNEKIKRWKEEWEAFYPDKNDDYILIKVMPVWMEIISYTRGIVSDINTWQPPIITFDSEQ